MLLTLTVTKVHLPVELTYDGEGLRIEGDFNAHKKLKAGRSCGCIPLPPPKLPDPTLLPIDHRHLLNMTYQDSTHMLHIQALIPRQPDQENKSTLDLYKFMYSVTKGQEQDAIRFCEVVMEDAYKGLVAQKRLKVLINPFGGQGQAKKIYEEQVRPIFEAAKCTVDIQYTEYQGHAITIAKELDITAYDAVVTVSGDGVIHEVINGFLQRSDARQAIRQCPLGVIPGGTGNALSICMLGEQQGFDPMVAALQVVKGRSLALDLCSVTYDDHRYFSFLSQNYGITSYADLGTENLRWMGDARTILGLLKEILSGNSYGMEAAVHIVENNKDTIQRQYEQAHASATWEDLAEQPNGEDGMVVDTIPALNEPVPEDWTKIEGKISFFLTSKTPLLARGMLSHPCALPSDGLLDLLLVRGQYGVMKQLGVFEKVEKGNHLDSKIVEYYKIKAFRLTPKPAPGQKAYVAIDGEHAPLKPFQVQVHPRLAFVLSFNPTFINARL
ncbi:ATP-NAD kinase-like domain-containing protein [Halteromyces radiatus]|uniref:ATP-NAD kinase-like domain-containing protein n=1 Tax=Halteromyces radiatus TaxID=101107 RepID=UPI0022206F2D|nr:ATP-NAD kinase-like domain-containing protein [Halteromyces radiatus]KAI8093821.1 ATP-NAD kinase-like domain-containing protein [Halteromyces radiatus]